MPDSLGPHELQSTGLLCPWDFPGKDTGVGCHFLLQRIFPTQGSNLGLLHCRQSLFTKLSCKRSPITFKSKHVGINIYKQLRVNTKKFENSHFFLACLGKLYVCEIKRSKKKLIQQMLKKLKNKNKKEW